MHIGCFEFEDECENPKVLEQILNEKLKEFGISAEDIISMYQPSGYKITHVFYKKK